MGITSSTLLWTSGAIGEAFGMVFPSSANRRSARVTFEGWSKGEGSLFDLMDDGATIVIPGVGAHCGAFQKSTFADDVAGPFMARFSKPPRPRPIKLWSEGAYVAIMAKAEGTRLDGKLYENDYVFVLKFRRGRVVEAVEFLDMAAFNDVWDHVQPAPVTERDR